MRWLNRIFRRELGEEERLIAVAGCPSPPASVLRTGGNCKERHNDCDDLPGFPSRILPVVQGSSWPPDLTFWKEPYGLNTITLEPIACRKNDKHHACFCRVGAWMGLDRKPYCRSCFDGTLSYRR